MDSKKDYFIILKDKVYAYEYFSICSLLLKVKSLKLLLEQWMEILINSIDMGKWVWVTTIQQKKGIEVSHISGLAEENMQPVQYTEH